MNSHIFRTMCAVALTTVALSGCGDSDKVSNNDYLADTDSMSVLGQDLSLYELKGSPREVTKTTYFDVVRQNDSYQIGDSTKTQMSAIRFSEDGKYLPKKDEKVRRDSEGRITYWENNHPVAAKVPIGFSKDTLGFKYIDQNHMVSDGMGQYAVVVYDDDHKIIGQTTVSRLNHITTSAHNIYKRFDKNGNWTERLTIWSTQGVSDPLPKVHYTIDKRTITYY